MFGLSVGNVVHSLSTSVLRFSANCLKVVDQQSNTCITEKLVLQTKWGSEVALCCISLF